MATRGSRSEPTASMHMPSPEGLAALAAMLQAAASPVHGQPGSSSALASPSTGGIGSAPQQAAREEQAGPPTLHNVQEGLVRIRTVEDKPTCLYPQSVWNWHSGPCRVNRRAILVLSLLQVWLHEHSRCLHWQYCSKLLSHMLGFGDSLLVCSALSLQCTAGGFRDCCSNESARAVLLGATQ